jgi:hypothetical protein
MIYKDANDLDEVEEANGSAKPFCEADDESSFMSIQA